APQSANGYLPSIGKWQLATPQQMGAFPAAALIFRLGLIDEAPPVVIERRPRDTLWARAAPLVAAQQGYDPNRDTGIFGTLLGSGRARQPDISPYSFLAGPVQVDFDSETGSFVHPDLVSLIDEDRQVVTSLTRELS
ncbi:hypothetical protein DYI26_24530, partial [Halomonas litopenaei]|nr:hypothetical protein [Halomonas litopenaei]